MRRAYLGALIGLLIFAASMTASYAVLDHFYGTEQITTSTQMMTIEGGGSKIVTDNIAFTVERAELTVDADNETYYHLLVTSETAVKSEVPRNFAPAPQAGEMATKDSSVNQYYIDVPAAAYDQALRTEEPITVTNVTLTKTEPVNTFPIAAGIGIVVAIAASAAWIGYRQSWGEATSALLELGLHDMTVRDVEVVGYIMQKGEFTIPELMKMTSASKITVWRTVQKLMEKGLVEQTGETKLAANGLGGRGKPSHIYRYVGEKGK